MPGAVRKSDVDCSGNPNMSASNDTLINNIPLVRYGDLRTHLKQNQGLTTSGAEVYCNNRHAQYVGHPIEQSSGQAQGSYNVIIN